MKNNIVIIVALTLIFISVQTFGQTFTKLNKIGDKSSTQGASFTALNGKLYFGMDDGIHGYELWISDGTEVGTHMIKDIYPGSSSSFYGIRGIFNNKIYFSANTQQYGNELWYTDGTDTGTNLLKDIDLYNSGTSPIHQNFGVAEVVEYNGKIYFAVDDSTHGLELWTSDGTEAGTHMVKDIFVGFANFYSSGISTLTVFNNKLYFCASINDNNKSGTNLWQSDGTTIGTFPVSNNLNILNAQFIFQDNNFEIQVLNNKLIFAAYKIKTNNAELWQSDGTSAGTIMLKEINLDTIKGSNPTQFYKYKNLVYFVADDGKNGPALWVTDGTTSNTKFVADFDSSQFSSTPIKNITGIGNYVYFHSENSHGGSMYRTDGTSSGTSIVIDFPNKFAKNYSKYSYTYIKDKLFFIGNEKGFGGDYNFYILNTNLNKYQKLAPANATVNTYTSSSFGEFGVLNDELYFVADFDNDGDCLWKYNDQSVGINLNYVQGIDDINIFPIPSNGVLNIVLENNLENATIKIINIIGQTVINKMNLSINNSAEIDISELPAGNYFVEITDGTTYLKRKIVKE